jgi:hypothetical protein
MAYLIKTIKTIKTINPVKPGHPIYVKGLLEDQYLMKMMVMIQY